MKRLIPFLLTLLVAGSLTAQDATITFLDGFVDIRKESGSQYPADFGDQLESGDRVITRRNAEAELELTDGGIVTVAPDTVFIIGSSSRPTGERTTRLSAAVGSFAFKFNAVVGNEPQVGSTTAVAGVRGTEVVVYAGSDGTTRFEVIEGVVELQDTGEPVSLTAAQGVEVAPGRGPSSVFAFLERPIDYGVWNAGLVSGFLDDPLPALRGVASEMRDILAEIERRAPGVEALLAESEEATARLDAIEEEDGRDARQKYFAETVMPLREQARVAFIDLRFLVLSALSLDQYVISRLAAEMDAAYILTPAAPVLADFQRELTSVRSDYEATVTRFLVPADL
jgi:hypothetical protein